MASNSSIDKGLRLCKAIGGETYIVGGAVRDMILGTPVKDVDLATNVPIDDICSRFTTHDIGKNKDFGIVVVLWEDEHFEVAHFRQDGQYTDNRRPDSVQLVDNIDDDLARRDFTINAMAYDGSKIIDPFGGQDDMKKGIIRFVGNAQDRIDEDGLRVLRAYRFASRFRFGIADEEVMKGYDLSKISQERVTEEIKKTASYSGKALAFLFHRTKENDIYLVKEIQDNVYPHQLKHHPEGDVFNHIISCLSQSDKINYLLNLCVLFHDIGKYSTLVYRDGKPTYHGHDKEGADMMNEVGERLKLSNDEIETIKYICENHMIWWAMTDMKKTKLLEIALHKDYDLLKEVCLCDEMSRLYLGDKGKWERNVKAIKNMLGIIRSREEYNTKIKSFVDGHRIMRLLPGIYQTDIGIIKYAVVEFITEKDFNTTQEEVDLFIKNYHV